MTGLGMIQLGHDRHEIVMSGQPAPSRRGDSHDVIGTRNSEPRRRSKSGPPERGWRFWTADADSGASRGNAGIEASGQEHSGDCARARIVACDGAAVSAQGGCPVWVTFTSALTIQGGPVLLRR